MRADSVSAAGWQDEPGPAAPEERLRDVQNQ